MKLADALKPSRSLWCSLAESNIKQSLESWSHQEANTVVSEGSLVSNKPVTSESLIEFSGKVLGSRVCIVEISLGNLSPAKNRVNCSSALWENLADHPVTPLFNLSSLNVVASEKGCAMGQICSDSNTFIDKALRSLKEWVQACKSLLSNFSLLVLWNMNNFNLFASSVGNSFAEGSQVV